MREIPVFEVALPDYRFAPADPGTPLVEVPGYRLRIPADFMRVRPDFHSVGRPVDDCLKRELLGEEVMIRAVASSQHASKTQDELIATIRRLGHDRYDPARQGERYENIEGRQIDLFGLPFVIHEDGEYLPFFVEPFYYCGIADRGVPERVDVLIVYRADHLVEVPHRYADREEEIKRDGFVFRDPSRRCEALRAIVKVT